MFSRIKSMWGIRELRNRLLFTFAILLVFRAGCSLAVPYVSAAALSAMYNNGTVLDYMNMLSGGALSRCAVFALGVSPYINATIIMQLLTAAFPCLSELKKDADGGKTLERYTKYLSVALAVVMAVGYYFVLRNYGALQYTAGASAVFAAIVIVSTFVAGAQLVVWLGGRIDDHGIGNGVSILIFAGIVSRWDSFTALLGTAWTRVSGGDWWFALVALGVVAFTLLSVYFVVYTNGSEKRIPIQYSGSRGRRGGASFLPLKLVMSGVLPIIFASSILSIPATIGMFVNAAKHPSLYLALMGFNSTNWLYNILYILLIFAFSFFYLEIQVDPVEMANRLRKDGAAIPGVRPGAPTAEKLQRDMHQLAITGSLILSLVALAPIVCSAVTGLQMQLSGTSLLIAVGVVAELMRAVDSYITVRHHRGFLN